MSNGPTLPPQAYTREILTSAFNWLQTQPESVKKLATSPDALVGLFMRAQRFGSSSLETDAPVSSQAFMSDLKDLAEGLKQFEDPREMRRPTAQQNNGYSSPAGNGFAGATVNPSHARAAMPTAAVANGGQLGRETRLAALSAIVNDKSLAMIQEVKAQLNLTDDVEAANMMIALAYKSLKTLLA